MNISTKWISTEYRNIQFHVDVITFEIATKKGNICLYFTKKEVRALKCYGITENMDIKQAYLKVS